MTFKQKLESAAGTNCTGSHKYSYEKDCDKCSGFKAGARFALTQVSEVRELVEAAEVVRLQSHGKANCWAGIWTFCLNEKCVRLGSFPKNEISYAFGGNWLGNDKECPECGLTKALTRFRELLEELEP